ncbi:hypothetical protein [Leptospira weilii]|uniref:Uncharacterized protein n=1 Tax=Leptospira weilii str. UI 13098 TaxID=1088542 RepID=M6QFP7_9LEPT|nr:hypothetical protein [Leptospira weilii]EMN91318.1 hypothetical protein LEP1GSC108_3298 [Leptospira weilii str. UI 13098]
MNDSASEVTYSNLLSRVESLLSERQKTYIQKPGMESKALNQFMLANIPAKKVLELIEKIIDIRRHPKMKLDPFWIGATENVSGAYSYMQKIDTVHSALWPEAEKKKEESNRKSPSLGWIGFLALAEGAGDSSRREIRDMIIKESIEDKTISVPACSDSVKLLLKSFFEPAGWILTIGEKKDAVNV